ncbi:glycosyltransferase family 2 protein [Daejeonella sp.]|uniref:glycosyltransferase family 2 protein n=1 Tax=Daejeonella sp. TaxID=2805397 RepID=UPI0039833236
MILAFWICFFIIFYTFFGYGLFLYLLVSVKRLVKKPYLFSPLYDIPSVTVIVAAYNEESLIEDKILNCLELNYPKNKVQFIFITDGSSDRTPEIVSKHTEIELLHVNQRLGKMAAIKRAMPFVSGYVTVFTDANTFLNKEALIHLVKHYQNPKIGAVAGEKKIMVNQSADASSAGEGFYWKYESALKRWDYELYSNVGAAGELFSIRTDLYQPVETDTIIDDHMIAMRIAEKGYIIAYEPNAFALESASADSGEELKRKIRIAAGGIQSVYRLKRAVNPFNNPVLTFQYISHRLLRWLLTPWLMIILFLLNIMIVFSYPQSGLYLSTLFLQILFYLTALFGWYLEGRKIKLKAAFIPFYFTMMNYAVIAGTFRYYNGAQSAAWEKSKRK